MNTQGILKKIQGKNQTNQLQFQFISLFNKVFSNQTQVISALNQQLIQQLKQQILQKCREFTQKNYRTLSQIIGLLVTQLVNRIQGQQALIKMDIIKSDYQTLELSLQKQQADIRGLFKINHQLQIIKQDIEQKLHQKSLKLEQANKIIVFLKNVKDISKQTIENYKKQKRELVKKIEFYQQKLYSINRQNRWETTEKSTQNILHKASIQFKDKNKLQPYFENLSKSKQIIFRRKQTYKLFKDNRYSKFSSSSSIKDKNLPIQATIQIHQNRSISHQDKKNSLSDLKSSVLMQVKSKKIKNRVLKNLTQISDK